MQLYLIDGFLKVKIFVKLQEKPLDVIKTANIGICHDQG